MNPIAINLGIIKVTWYSVFISIGVILAYVLIEVESKKQNINEKVISNAAFWCVIFGILGARIYYVLFNLDYYLNNISEIIKIWHGGLAIHGGIIAGVITLYYHSKKYNINFIKLLDIVAPAVIIAQAIGRWGNFFNSEAHGPSTTLNTLVNLNIPKFIIDGMKINGVYYHPTFLYESVGCLMGFIILLIIRKIKKVKTGTMISFYLIWYGIIRFLIESLRTDSLLLGNIKVAQLVSSVMIIIGIAIYIISSKNKKLYNNK